MATPKRYDKIFQLEKLNAMIALPVTQHVQAAIVIWAVQSIFAEMPASFRFHPGKTLLFQAVSALEQRSTIELVDLIKNTKLRKLPPQVEWIKKKLMLHRDRLSHPFLVNWDTPEKQTFADSKREWIDVRSAFVLNFANSINSELLANGKAPKNDDIPVTMEMASLIHSILQHSANRELSEAFSPTDSIVFSLHKFKEAFYLFCTKHVE